MGRSKIRHKRRRVSPKVPIAKWGAPELRAKCKPVTPGEATCIGKMVRALRQSKNGVGLAAPQIGVLERVILVWPNRVGEPLVMLNPDVLDRSAETETRQEGCLSYPGVFTDVERHCRIRIKWDTPQGDPRIEWFDGFAARVVQHEIDHLNGVCLVGDYWRSTPPNRPEGQETDVSDEVDMPDEIWLHRGPHDDTLYYERPNIPSGSEARYRRTPAPLPDNVREAVERVMQWSDLAQRMGHNTQHVSDLSTLLAHLTPAPTTGQRKED